MAEVAEEPVKKKRGRPRKENPYRDFQPNVQETFKDYAETYAELIESFYNVPTEARIEKPQWEEINNHVKQICERLETSHDFNHKFDKYNYRPNTSWRGIDKIREEQRKKFVNEWYNNANIDNVYKGYMVFSHLKLYIVESSKEMKV